MLSIRNLSFLQSGIPLLRDINLQVFANQRVGLVGRNGCGKSTLFQLIRGEIAPDQGEVSLQKGKTLAFVEQEIVSSAQAALAFTLEGDAEWQQLQAVLESNMHDADWFAAQHRFEEIDGYGAPARAAQLLNGLGFSQTKLEQSVSSFSGGWRMRLNLARALMRRADLLLLDEPTNHLDLEAIIWLEEYLARYPGSLIVVSHDREFLNACVNQVAYMHDGVIDAYSGNYDKFERAMIERMSQQEQAFQQQQQQIAHMEDFVRRFRAKATKAKQAQSRLKALERLVRIAPVHGKQNHCEFKIEAPERGPDLLIEAESAGFKYGDQLIFDQVNFSLRAGARAALIGPNGAGKSTLIKLLIGEIKPTAGQVHVNSDIRIGYFAQHQLEYLDGNQTPLQHVQKIAPGEKELVLRNFLGGFGLAGNDEDRPVATFSGGEKSRLALALIAYQKPHILLLDEPTNHLDMEMRDLLTLALEEYVGAVVLVSHDRGLIKAIADELWLVADRSVKLFDGDLEEYKKWFEKDQALKTERVKIDIPINGKSVLPEIKPRPNKKFLFTKQVKLETSIISLQVELDAINSRLIDSSTYINLTQREIQVLDQNRSELEKKIEILEEEWLELLALIEA
ncbi:MAG: ABC-F family ATP-binding cassette domain-containing protein [Nitrosomonas sp.]|nr:ABC-F family ATP-binding cassette domain-containing protein [Nitrosomonas sp.]